MSMAEMTAPISVVIPAYNAAAFLDATLASISAQTLPVAQIIVVNDGSTDGTRDIASRAGVKIVDQANAGLSAARNSGIAAATQPWIAFCDADDLWLPEKIERQWRSILLAPRVAFSFTDYMQFNETGVINASVLHEVHRHFEGVLHHSLGDDAWLCDPESLGSALLVDNFFSASSLIVRADAAREFGGYDRKVVGAEDYDFALRLTRVHFGTYVDLPIVHYRRHASAISSNVATIREGVTSVALRVLSRPQEYAPRTVKHFKRSLHKYFTKCGFAHLRYGDQLTARRWLRRSLGERLSPEAGLLYLMTFAFESSAGQSCRNRMVRIMESYR